MELRIGDRAALYSLPLPAKGGVCGQQPLVRLAVDHVLPRIPGPRDVARADYRTCFTVTVGRTACAWAALVIAIGANNAAAKARVSAVLMIITLVLLG
jgi:hypothetical protein